MMSRWDQYILLLHAFSPLKLLLLTKGEKGIPAGILRSQLLRLGKKIALLPAGKWQRAPLKCSFFCDCIQHPTPVGGSITQRFLIQDIHCVLPSILEDIGFIWEERKSEDFLNYPFIFHFTRLH